MPSNLIKHDIKEGKGSKKQLEKDWDRAKKAAEKGAKNKKNPYPLATYIYERIRDAHKHGGGQKQHKSKSSVAAPLDEDLTIDHGLAQPGVTVAPSGPMQQGGNGGSSSLYAKDHPIAATVRVNAAKRITARRSLAKAAFKPMTGLHHIESDAFEGWINTLKYKYKRPEGKDYAIVDASEDEVRSKLKREGWTGGAELSKGEHTVRVEDAGDGRAKITSIK